MATAKRGQFALTNAEKKFGTILFILYLVVFPFLIGKILDMTEILLDVRIGDALGSVIYYYLLFAVTLVVFHSLLAKACGNFLKNIDRTIKILLVSLIAFYGLNEILYRVFDHFFGHLTNLNDVSIAHQISASPQIMVLIVVFLCPVIEEVLFRGLVFGGLHPHSRLLAYAVSCALFALMHVWQFALMDQNITYLIMAIQYLVPGLVFAWSYEHSGNLLTPILTHICVNALSVFMILS